MHDTAPITKDVEERDDIEHQVPSSQATVLRIGKLIKSGDLTLSPESDWTQHTDTVINGISSRGFIFPYFWKNTGLWGT